MPAGQDDRLVGAILAGLPTPPAPKVSTDPIGSTFNSIQDPWLYGRIPNVAERGSARSRSASIESPLGVGLRDHSMRTPGQLQQNYPRELAISEAAALAGVDAIEFRLKHTDDAAPDRRAEGGARGIGLADASVAAPEGGCRRARRRSRDKAFR